MKCEFAGWIKLAEKMNELWGFCECLMHVLKTVKHFFDSLSNYVLLMKSCAIHWVTTELKGAGIGQSL